MDIDLLMSLAHSRVTRNLTDKEALRYLHLELAPAIPGSEKVRPARLPVVCVPYYETTSWSSVA